MSTYLIHSAKGKTWKNHKYIDIKNGTYIYPKFMYDRSRKKQNEQKTAIFDEKKRLNDQKYSDYMQVELNNRSGRYSKKKYEEAKSDVRNKYKPLEDSNKKQIEANAYARIKELYKYQNSLNYKASKAISNFLAKGKSFLDKLFGKKKKTKRTTEQALALNNKLRAPSRVIKRKGFGKYSKFEG